MKTLMLLLLSSSVMAADYVSFADLEGDRALETFAVLVAIDSHSVAEYTYLLSVYPTAMEANTSPWIACVDRLSARQVELVLKREGSIAAAVMFALWELCGVSELGVSVT